MLEAELALWLRARREAGGSVDDGEIRAEASRLVVVLNASAGTRIPGFKGCAKWIRNSKARHGLAEEETAAGAEDSCPAQKALCLFVVRLWTQLGPKDTARRDLHPLLRPLQASARHVERAARAEHVCRV